METFTCGICLDQLRVPVCTPCGHLCCEACITSYIESSADAMSASCPTCRASFTIAIPDLRFVPKKYHTLIVPSIRRVFIADASDASVALSPSTSTASSQTNRHSTLTAHTTHELHVQIASLTDKVAALERDKMLLMDRCEAAIHARDAHAHGERERRLESERLQQEMAELRSKYESVKGKYKALRSLQKHPSNAFTVPASSTTAMTMTTMTSGKRKSGQAALDALPHASSSSEHHELEHGDYYTLGDQDAVDARARPMVKRPRLLGSPFDLAKRLAARRGPQPCNSRSRMLIDEDEEGDSGFRASDFEGEDVSSSGGPQRSGLLKGDIFSPRAGCGGIGSFCFELGEGESASQRFEKTVRAPGGGFGMRPAWLLSPEDE